MLSGYLATVLGLKFRRFFWTRHSAQDFLAKDVASAGSRLADDLAAALQMTFESKNSAIQDGDTDALEKECSGGCGH